MKRILLLLFLLCIIGSCNSLRNVLKDPDKLEIAGRAWEKKNPCVVDSIVRVIEGQETIVVDSSVYRAYLDTLTRLKGRLTAGASMDYSTIIDSLLAIQPAPIYIRKSVHDTLQIIKRDLRHERILQDSVYYYIGRSALLQGKLDISIRDVKEQKEALNKSRFKLGALIFFLVILLVGSHLLRSYVKIPFL
jgi:hypothetical protein